MRAGLSAIVGALSAVAASANAPGARVGPDGFDAVTMGYTYYFGLHGAAYGAEQYLPGRKVRWQSPDGSCVEGRWYGDGPALCFVYDGSDGPVCWDVFMQAETMTAREIGGQGVEIISTGRDTTPLACPGPDLGV